MSYADSKPGYRITTAEEATNVVVAAVKQVEEARAACNVSLIHATAEMVRGQKKAYARMLMWHGHAFGALVMAHRVGLLSDEAYENLRKRITDTMVPTVIGEVSSRVW